MISFQDVRKNVVVVFVDSILNNKTVEAYPTRFQIKFPLQSHRGSVQILTNMAMPSFYNHTLMK